MELVVINAWRAAGEALPKETRQKFLDAIWGGHSVGNARRIAMITFDEAMGIMDMNIESVGILRRESK